MKRLWNWLLSEHQHDLTAYVAAAWNLRRGRSIYRTHHQAVPDDPTLGADIPHFIYPPIVAVMFMPATLLAYCYTRRLSIFLSLALVVHGAWLICSLLPNTLVIFAVCMAAMLFGDPLWWLLRTGQVDGFVFWLTASGMYCYAHDMPVLAGLALAIACWTKLTPALISTWLLIYEKAGFAGWFCLFAGLLFLAQVIWLRPELRMFLRGVLPGIMRWRAPMPAAQSLHAFYGRKKARLMKSSIIVLAGGALLITRQHMPAIGILACCAMLLPNLGWIMQFIGALLPIAIVAAINLPMGIACAIIYCLNPRGGGPSIAVQTAFCILWIYTIMGGLM